MEMRIMDKAIIELLARRAGLDKALEEFPEDGLCMSVRPIQI